MTTYEQVYEQVDIEDVRNIGDGNRLGVSSTAQMTRVLRSWHPGE